MQNRALVAELLGTFVLCFLGCGAVVASGGSLITVGFAHAIAIVVMGTALGGISGGHFNPAVSFAMAVTGRMKWGDMAFYWIAQCLGACLGAFLVKVCFPASGTVGGVGLPTIVSEILPWQGAVLEGIGTFFLVIAIFGTAVSKDAPKVGALMIGLSILGVICCIGPATGAGINPARWFGPAAVMKSWENAWVYVVAPLIGAALAGLTYQRYLVPDLDAEPA